MRKIFIDCGFNKGKVSSEFYSKNKDFLIYAFEPNPYLDKYNESRKKYIGKNLFFYNKGVFNKNTNLDFTIGVGNMEGSSIFDKKYLSNIKLNLEFIDFSEFLFSNFTKDDYLILKMDIEGCEYTVLPHLIEQKSIFMINKFIIEFHNHKLGNKFSKEHEEIKKFFHENKFYTDSIFWHL